MSTVIVAGAVIGGAMGFGGGLYGVSKGNRQLIKAFNKQMYYAQLNYNYNQAQLTKQQTSMYHNAMNQLGQLSYNAYINNATVQAAQAQTGYEGRTSQAISRVVQGQTLRQKTAVKDSYQNAVANVRSQKDALYIQMVHNVDQAKENLSNSFTHGFQAFMQVLDSTAKGAAAGAFGGAVAGAASGAAGGTAGAMSSSGLSAAGSGVTATSASTVAGGTATTSLGSGFLSSGATTTASAGSSGLMGYTSLSTATTSQLASSSALSSSFGSSFMGNLNSMYSQNQGLFSMLNNFSTFTSQFNRRGGNYY